MGKLFTADTKELNYLLASIHNRERALPDFQRDFVWDANAIRELLYSILRNFPAGSLLEIQQKENLFKPRAFQGAPELIEGYVPPYLVLDGQQRLTSLYQALYGTGRHRYYINIGKYREEILNIHEDIPLHEVLDLDDAIFYELIRNNKNKDTERWDIEKQAECLVLPISRILGEKNGYGKWKMQVAKVRKEKNLYSLEDDDLLLRFDELIDNLTNYHFPVITLSNTVPTEAVCTIFETLNRTGVKLSVFDLLVARFYADNIRLRESWQKALEENPILAEFTIDPYYLLQVIALRCTEVGMGECKRGTVLKLSTRHYLSFWNSTVLGFVEGLKLLRDSCGVLASNWLPYAPFLISLAAVIAETKSSIYGHEEIVWKSKLQRWFWASTFTQAYENSSNSAAKSQYLEMLRWIKDGEEPSFIKEAFKQLDVIDLEQITPEQRALYRGFMCLVLRKGIRDFYKGEPITSSKILLGEVNDHHIFPKAVYGKGEWKYRINSIPNRTLIDERSNKIISSKSPSEYIMVLEKDSESRFILDIFNDHLIPVDECSYIKYDDLESFVKYRSQALLNEARNALGNNYDQERSNQSHMTQEHSYEKLRVDFTAYKYENFGEDKTISVSVIQEGTGSTWVNIPPDQYFDEISKYALKEVFDLLKDKDITNRLNEYCSIYEKDLWTPHPVCYSIRFGINDREIFFWEQSIGMIMLDDLPDGVLSKICSGIKRVYKALKGEEL